MWRVWIEIQISHTDIARYRSPSVWRVWIEIQMLSMVSLPTVKSPSVWRVWIEIQKMKLG